MSQLPPVPPTAVPVGPEMYQRPHRGGVVLALGILGLVICVICGIIAWVMGNSDLRDMEAGRMDASGRGLTQAGRICGMISCFLVLAGIGIYILILVFVGVAGVTGI